MNYAQADSNPRRFVGFAVVVIFHALVVYALVTGLAKKMVDVVRAPIETKVIEEIKKPPPPPEIVVPPPPKLEAPPPPFIPPPEIQIANPPPAPTITATTPTPPPAPVAIAPIARPSWHRPGAAGGPGRRLGRGRLLELRHRHGRRRLPARSATPRHRPWEAVVQFTLTASGELKDIRAIRSSNPIFARNSVRIVSEYKCQGQGRDVTVVVPFGYKLE